MSTAVATVEAAERPYIERSATLAPLTTQKAKALIEPMLKHGVKYERILSEAYFAIQANPKLADCTAESMITAVAQCVKWDLVIGEKAYLVPFSVKVKTKGERRATKYFPS